MVSRMTHLVHPDFWQGSPTLFHTSRQFGQTKPGTLLAAWCKAAGDWWFELPDVPPPPPLTRSGCLIRFAICVQRLGDGLVQRERLAGRERRRPRLLAERRSSGSDILFRVHSIQGGLWGAKYFA